MTRGAFDQVNVAARARLPQQMGGLEILTHRSTVQAWVDDACKVGFVPARQTERLVPSLRSQPALQALQFDTALAEHVRNANKPKSALRVWSLSLSSDMQLFFGLIM